MAPPVQPAVKVGEGREWALGTPEGLVPAGGSVRGSTVAAASGAPTVSAFAALSPAPLPLSTNVPLDPSLTLFSLAPCSLRVNHPCASSYHRFDSQGRY